MSAEEIKNKWKDVIAYIEDRSDNFNKDLDSLLKTATQQTQSLQDAFDAQIEISQDAQEELDATKGRLNELQKENERLKESLNKIDNLIGNYMHNDSYKIGTLVLDIQEIAVKN